MDAQIFSLGILLLFVFFFGSLISAIFWFSYRDAVYKKMLLFWLSNLGQMILIPLVQKVGGGSLALEAMVSTAWVGLTMIPILISMALELNRVPGLGKPLIRLSFFGVAAGLVTGLVTREFFPTALVGNFIQNLPFLAALLYLQFLKPGPPPSPILSGFNISTMLLLVHFMDYPFLRPVASFAPLGFTIYAGIAIGLMVFMQGRIVEMLHQAGAAVLEKKVGERTADLEAFSFSVSHDLRAPLRAMNGFADIVLGNEAGLKEESKKLLERIRQNAVSMGQLVDDLLTFSRSSRQAMKAQKVDPAALLKQCLEELQGEFKDRHVEVRQEELPACEGDPSLLKQVWLNLLSNALKYSRKKDPAIIEIGSLEGEQPGELVYFVKDNGVGFDMQYAGKLFGVFQRLQRESDFEGTGVGLAIVKRILSRHGGRIWAHSKPDEGACFYLALKKA